LPCAAVSAGHYVKYREHGVIGEKKCGDCDAELFRDEESNECCGYGKVKCKPFTDWDETYTDENGHKHLKHKGLQHIKYLLDPDNSNPDARNFKDNIITYNTVHCPGSLSTNTTLPPGSFPRSRRCSRKGRGGNPKGRTAPQT
jgi:hypothetical protein